MPLEGARTLYGATKLGAELPIEEYRAAHGLRAVINRCGVVAGPWQMGKVDQGVFAYWVLAHHFGHPLEYIGFDGSGKQVRDLLHVEDLIDLLEEQLVAPERWDGVNGKRRRRPRIQPLPAGGDRAVRRDLRQSVGRWERGLDSSRRCARLYLRLHAPARADPVATKTRAVGGPRGHRNVGPDQRVNSARSHLAGRARQPPAVYS